MVFVHCWKSLYSEAFIVITLIYELLFAPVRGEIRSLYTKAHVSSSQSVYYIVVTVHGSTT